MDPYITLIGSERVEHAGREIAAAAETFRRAVGDLAEELRMQRQFMDDWLDRFQAAPEPSGEGKE